MKSIKHPFSRRSLAKLCPPRVTFRFTIQFKRPATPLIFLMNLEAVARINPASFRPGILLTGEIPPWKTNIEAPVIVLINQEFVGKKKRIVNVSCIRKLIPPPPRPRKSIFLSRLKFTIYFCRYPEKMNDLQICQLINRTKLSSEKKRLLLFRASFDESPARKNYISKLLSSIKSLKRRRKEKSKDDHEEWNRRITQQFFIPSDVLFAMSFVPNICRKKEKKNRKTSVNRWGGRIVGKEKKRRRHRRQERAEKQYPGPFSKRGYWIETYSAKIYLTLPLFTRWKLASKTLSFPFLPWASYLPK